ncbi:LPXTG cell wall anchor domain-containing protein [Breznakia pachnodae]|uniref:LPXTG-motif cell wall-anchored protein n=1 Tax=Breznakia pachnodae TaxID=265178 RepID=A0ABU0E2G3_9FIRM|nr:LPXTG cell wall anchor domain-containing protein [Breznakia pachnodae]MDQ0361081.1 LPXTG-motif cell wall-anchored protein [Breznakia pachnodae]
MKRIKLLFGSALALVLALSLFVPATVSAEETDITPTDTPVATAAYTMDQAAFDADYPDGVKQGEIFDISDYYDGDISELYLYDYTGEGFAFWEIDETTGAFLASDIWVLSVGDVNLEFVDVDGNLYALDFDVIANPVDIVLDPTTVTLAPGESKTILIDTVPEDAWWFWAELALEGSDGVMVNTKISDTTVIKVEEAYDENDEWIGYTVTGLKAGTATISIETELGHTSVATITVKSPEKPISQPPATTTTTKPAVAANNGGPVTGDTTNTTMYMLMMLAALASVSGYAFLKKQK